MITRRAFRSTAMSAAAAFFLLFPVRFSPGVELSKEEKDYLRRKGSLVFVSQTRYPPFEFVSKGGEHTGMCIELIRWMATELGFTARFTDTTFQKAQEAVLSGEADVLTSLFYSERRDDGFDFTEVMFDVPASIFVSAQRPDIKALSDLEGKRIAMQAGDYAKEFLEARGIAFEVVYTENFAEATDLVIEGQADAIIGDEQIVLYHVFTDGLADRIKKVGEPLYIGQDCLAVREGAGELVGILNKGIRLAKESGTLEKINRKWLGTRYTLRESWLFRHLSYLPPALGVIIVLILWFWLWNIRLRQMVERRTEELRESEERYRRLFQNVPVGLYRTTSGPRGRFIMANPALARMFGYGKAEDLLHTSVSDLYQNPAARGEFSKKLLREGHVAREELRFKRTDGTLMWGAVTAKVIRDKAGKASCFDGMVEDITARRRAEDALAESEEKYRSIFHDARDGIVLVDSETGCIAECNPEFERQTGRTIGQLRKMKIWELRPPRKVEMARKMFFEIREKGFGVSEELEVQKPGGEITPVEFVTKAVKIRDRNYLQSIARDIAARKRAEEELRRITKAVESSNEAIGMSDPQGHHFYQNRAFTDLFGYATEELAAKGGGAAVYTDQDVARDVFSTIMAGNSWNGELQMISKSGRSFPVFLRADAIKDDAGEIIGLMGIHADITERKRLEEQLRHAQKMEAVGTLAGGLAHDFNNILAGIRGYASLARQDLGAESPLLRNLERIEMLSRRGADLTSALLAFSRKGKYRPEPLNVNDLVRSVLSVIGDTAGKGLDVRTELSDEISNVYGDEGQIHQALMNLCLNACEAMPRGGTLTVRSRNAEGDEESCRVHPGMEKEAYICVTVSDTGEGMSPEIRAHIFEPFFTTRSEKTGRGLGLAMVIGIVENHGGSVEAESQPGRGSTFRVYLPATGEEVREPPPAPPRAIGGSGTILLVDDEEDFRESTALWLDRRGYSVIQASGGEEALRVLEEKGEGVDLVLLDMVMKGMEGAETFRRMRAVRPDLPVIICTGYSIDATCGHLLKEDSVDIIRKPFAFDDLSEKMRRVLTGLGT